MKVIESLAPQGTLARIVDLACGTGRFTVPLANHFGGCVIGIEPAIDMLSQAGRTVGPAWLRASAEQIPLAEASVDLVLASMATHHFDDLERATAEVARALRAGGRYLIRGGFVDRFDSPLYRFFPSAARFDRQRCPSRSQLERVCAERGLYLAGEVDVEQQVARDLVHYAERMSGRPYSSFATTSDAELAAGIRAMQAEAARVGGAPVLERIPILAFERVCCLGQGSEQRGAGR
jgi:SAM-dependent methyltransferase